MTLILFLIAFFALLIAGLNLLPVGSLPAEISTSFETLVGTMKAWEFLLPINTLFLALVFVVSVDLALLGWWIIKWMITLVRGGSAT